MNRLKLSKSEMVFAEETLKEFQSNNRSIEKSPELQMVQNRLRRNVESKQMVVNTLAKNSTGKPAHNRSKNRFNKKLTRKNEIHH